jgi:hypothetical protein
MATDVTGSRWNLDELTPCSFGLSATSQQYFSLGTINYRQPSNSTSLSEQTSTSHQPTDKLGRRKRWRSTGMISPGNSANHKKKKEEEEDGPTSRGTRPPVQAKISVERESRALARHALPLPIPPVPAVHVAPTPRGPRAYIYPLFSSTRINQSPPHTPIPSHFHRLPPPTHNPRTSTTNLRPR